MQHRIGCFFLRPENGSVIRVVSSDIALQRNEGSKNIGFITLLSSGGVAVSTFPLELGLQLSVLASQTVRWIDC